MPMVLHLLFPYFHHITDETLPLNAVYYSDKSVNLLLRVFLDFLVEELRG